MGTITLVTEDMKMGELKAIAKEVGVTYKVGMTKAALVVLINNEIIGQDGSVEVIEMEENKQQNEEVQEEVKEEEVPVSEEENKDEVPSEDTDKELTDEEFEASGQERNYPPHPMEVLPQTDRLEESDVKPATDESDKPAENKENKRGKKREEEAKLVEELKGKEEVKEILKDEQTKADKIRSLLALGIERKYVARLMNIRYQMVYQVEQRMLATKKAEELRAQAIEVKEAIREIGLEQARKREEYSEELLVEVERIFAEEEQAAAKEAKQSSK